MSKLLKISLVSVGAVLVVIVLAVAAFALFFDANDFRGRITSEVKNSTGRSLTLGDIRLSLFPGLGASVKNATLSNASGFGETPFAVIGEADIGVQLLPLIFGRELRIGAVSLRGLQLNLAQDATGRNNWDDLLDGNTDAAKEDKASADTGLKSIDIGGIGIEDAAITYADAKAKETYSLSRLNLKTSSIRHGKPFDFALDFATGIADPAIKANVSLDAKMSLDSGVQRLTVDKAVLKIKAISADLNADVDLSSSLTLDLKTKVYKAEKLTVKTLVVGKSLPGGTQRADFTGDAIYDGSRGSLKLAGGELLAAGLTIAIALDGSGLNGDAPRFTGPVSIKPFNPRELLRLFGTTLDTADAGTLKEMSLKARLDANKSNARLDNLKIKLDQSTIAGSAGFSDLATWAAEFALKMDSIDADRYLPPKTVAAAPSATPITPADKARADAAALPIDVLDRFNASGTLDIGKLKLSGVNMSNVRIKLEAVKGRDKKVDLASALYGGNMTTTTRITPGARPTYSESLRLTSIAAGPFLKDFTGRESMTGEGGLSLELTGAGKTVGDLRRALDGDVSFGFTNGAVKGFNLGQILRKGQALFKGQQFNESEPQQTDFTELSGAGKISNGVLRSDSLNAKSPLFRLDGAGRIDFVNETIDYIAKPMVVNTAGGQGGKELAELAGVVIPIRITGSFDAPHYSLDLQTALQQKAADKLRVRLDDQIQKKLGYSPLKETISEGLNALFGKKKKPEDAPKQP